MAGAMHKHIESSSQAVVAQDSQMSARDKTGLGYGTQLNELSSNHETDSENSLSIFDARSSDEENTPENDRFLKNGQTNDANTEKPKSASESVVSNPKIDRDRVIIEDWNSDDEEEVNEVQTVRPETQTVKTRDDKSGRGTTKPSVSTTRPVCTARPSVSTARHVCTARPICTARLSVSTARPVYASRPIYLRMDNVRPRGSCSPIKRSYYIKPALRPKAVVNTGKGNPEILLQDHTVVDSGCSSHMIGNKAYLSDYEDFNGLEVIPKESYSMDLRMDRSCAANSSYKWSVNYISTGRLMLSLVDDR
ncbi:hypothetical protein Tco_0667196 [Tanacetum coccineum]